MDYYNFLVVHCHIFLPPYRECSLRKPTTQSLRIAFLKGVQSREKYSLSRSEVVPMHVPQYEEVSE